MPQIRLQRGGAYTSDISTLRDAIRANAVNVNCVAIPVTHPLAPGQQPILYVNLAYQANSQMPPAGSSLYTVAFSNGAGAGFRFNLPAFAGTFPGFAALASDGSYGSLGYALPPFPDLTDANLGAAVAAVCAYAGGAPDAVLQVSLVRLVIAVSEAVRFAGVESGVDGLLGGPGLYTPPWDQIHSWGGHTLGAGAPGAPAAAVPPQLVSLM